MVAKKHDIEKARYWERMIREAARSRVSIPEFCRQRKLEKSQFYWWRRRLEDTRHQRTRKGANRERTSFELHPNSASTTAVVSDPQ